MAQQIRAQHHCRRVSEVGLCTPTGGSQFVTPVTLELDTDNLRRHSHSLTTPLPNTYLRTFLTVLAHCHGEFRLSPGRNQGVGPTPVSSVLWRLPLIAFKVSYGRGSGFMAGGQLGRELGALSAQRPPTVLCPSLGCSATQLFVGTQLRNAASQSETSFFDQSSHLLGQAHPA